MNKPTRGRLSKTITGKSWYGLLRRCYNPKSDKYKYYGGRGISVCDFIRLSPANLVSVIGERPSRKYSIDRPDNNGHYSCGSCSDCQLHGWSKNIRWASREEQARNKRTNRIICINGVSKTLSEWVFESGLSRRGFKHRLKNGMRGLDLLQPAHLGKRLRDRHSCQICGETQRISVGNDGSEYWSCGHITGRKDE